MKVTYGERSQAAFDTLDLRLQRVLLYIKNILEIDHSILEGHRDEETQNRYYEQRPKITNVKWPDSAHNTKPSKAVDVVPYVRIEGKKGGIHWHDRDNGVKEKYYLEMIRFSTIFQMVALLVFQLEIRSGIDWDGDYSLIDTTFLDAPHQEISDG